MGYRGIFLLACCFAGSASAATINVPADQSTIQAAINAANSGDTVLVAPGTYYEQLDFKGKAITVKSSGGAATTILDGNNSGPILWFHNNEGGTSVLRGFTLTHASTNSDGSGGSAVELTEASPTIEDNVFVNNTNDSEFLPAMAIFGYFSSAVVVRNYFADNVHLGEADDFTAVVSLTDGAPVVADNVFVSNVGIACYEQILDGEAPQTYNNTMVGNLVGLHVNFLEGPGSFFSNNLIAFNDSGVEFAVANDVAMPPFTDNLVYGNTTANYQQIADQTGTNGNISLDPSLKDWADGDVHLLFGSPAIDAGDSTVTQVSSTDFYGAPRVAPGLRLNSAVVDIGAAEYVIPVVTAVGGTLAVQLNTAKTGTLSESGADPAENVLFTIVTPPAHGTVTLTDDIGGAIRYVPANGYLGTDSFTFTVTDPYGTISDAATEQVTIADIAPTANGVSLITKPDIAVTGKLSATLGYAGQTLTYSVVTKPAHGSVSITAGTGYFRYVPSNGYAGTDSFTFQVKDALGALSNIAAVSVTVNDIAPKSTSSKLRAVPGRSTSGTLEATKAYTGQTLTFSIVNPPTRGTLTITNPKTGAFTYTPTGRLSGTDSFTFQVVDQWGTVSNTATISAFVR